MGTKKIILHGGGGHAKVVAECLIAQNKTVVAIVDPKGSSMGLPVYEQYSQHLEPGAFTVIAIGDNAVRQKIAAAVHHAFDNAIHPSAMLSESSIIGDGCMILHGTIVQARTKIGHHVILNTGCQVDHDCVIHNYAHVAPGAVLCGNVMVGEGALIGAGAVVIPGRKIGAWTMVGAGSVVTQDLPDHVVAVGNPARVIKQI